MDVNSVCTLAEPGVSPTVLPETFNMGSSYTEDKKSFCCVENQANPYRPGSSNSVNSICVSPFNDAQRPASSRGNLSEIKSSEHKGQMNLQVMIPKYHVPTVTPNQAPSSSVGKVTLGPDARMAFYPVEFDKKDPCLYSGAPLPDVNTTPVSVSQAMTIPYGTSVSTTHDPFTSSGEKMTTSVISAAEPTRPHISYLAMIGEAILKAPEQKILLADIYK